MVVQASCGLRGSPRFGGNGHGVVVNRVGRRRETLRASARSVEDPLVESLRTMDIDHESLASSGKRAEKMRLFAISSVSATHAKRAPQKRARLTMSRATALVRKAAAPWEHAPWHRRAIR